MKTLLRLCWLAMILGLGAGQAAGQYTWTKDTRNPVLSGGPSGAWNYRVAEPSVIFNADSSRYEMWFVGFTDAFGPNGDYRPYYVGFASSKDGIDWTMYPSPVLSPTPGTWDAYTVERPMVIRENGQYKMWYSSYLYLPSTYPGQIGYATSPDGIHWTKYSGNPVLGPGTAAWEASGPYSCAVMPFPGGYRMWYAGFDTSGSKSSIGYATSSDGIAWLRDTVNNPVLKAGASGQWDSAGVEAAQVLQIRKTYYMWYTGLGSSGNPQVVGVATSNDTGKTWTKYAGNPVLTPSVVGWDGTWLGVGTVLQRGDTLHMWYDGNLNPYTNHRNRIGHATAPVTALGISEREQEVPQQFMLCQNYPNPFNPSTTIRYALAHRSHVTLTVLNTLGQQVAQLINSDIDAGYHEIQFNATNLASGVYFYRIQAGSFVETRSLILLR